MPPDEPTLPSNGDTSQTPAEQPRPSLREVAEASWDEVQDAALADDGGEPSQQTVDEGGRRRDAYGRFLPADQGGEPGEQSQDPAPKPVPAPDATKPVDPALGSNQPPQHWPEQARQMFAKQSPEAQAFLLERVTSTERDYQAKAQAAATAVQFTQSLAPIFQDPVIAGSLQQAGVSPHDAIGQWAGFHRRAMDPNPAVRAALHQELGQRMGLNPAATGQMSQPGQVALSEEDLKDPAIRYFADHISKTLQEQQALRGELNQMQQETQKRANAEVLKVTRWSIDSFADEKDASGQPKRPHFDAVLPLMIDLFRANPERDIQEAYDYAIWAVPSVREKLLAAERQGIQQQQGNLRARQAVRSNVRGITSPVAKPAGDGKSSGLRATLEAAAEEIGLS
jgi:hypothetical protein